MLAEDGEVAEEIGINEQGFFKLNSFQVPYGVLDISRKLKKNELIALLHVLSKRPVPQALKKDLQELIAMNIVTKDGKNARFIPHGEQQVKFIKETNSIIGDLHSDTNTPIPTFKDMWEGLPEFKKKAIRMYLAWLKHECKINFSEKHINGWISKVEKIEERFPDFTDKAIIEAINKKSTRPENILEIAKNLQERAKDEDPAKSW